MIATSADACPVRALSPGRREANKLRTRSAVVEAVYRLLETRPLDSLTAERVADEAGISRRTFFNYFPSVEAVVGYSVEGVVEQLRAALGDRPGDESLVDSAKFAVAKIVTPEVFPRTVRAWRTIGASPAAKRYSLEADDAQLVEFIHEWVTTRFDSVGTTRDRLQISVMLAALLGAFHAARDYWLEDYEGPLDEAARADFIDAVQRAFELTRPMIDRP